MKEVLCFFESDYDKQEIVRRSNLKFRGKSFVEGIEKERKQSLVASKEETEKIYYSFVRELTEWSEKGILPENGNQDTAYYLELQQNRLKKRNIRIKYRFSERIKRKKENEADPGLVGWTARDQKYTIKMTADDYSKEVRCYKENKCLFREKKDTLFYQAITYLNDDSVNGDELYCCPNCSAISSVKSLLTGCPYCGTRFQMTDLFPKVTNFFYSDFGINYIWLSGSKMIGAGLAAFVTLLGLLRAQSWGAAVQTLLSGLFFIPFASFLGYMAFACFTIFYSLVSGISATPRYVGKNRARNRITSFFEKYDPAFSYDYFIGKMVSVLKIILFADDRSNLVVCQGKVDEAAFQDIVDIAYRNAVTLNSCQVEGKYCYLDINMYMSDIHYGGSRIYKKNDIFRLKLCKNITKPEDYGFSIRKVQCRSCGGSFDAARIKYCPYCGTEYDLKEDDWVVLDIKQVK